MKKAFKYVITVLLLSLALSSCKSAKEKEMADAAREVIERTVGELNNVSFRYIEPQGKCDRFEIEARDGHLSISGSSPSAMCYAFNRYWRLACRCMQTWGGENGSIPEHWPDYCESLTSPYELRYFLNVCTFGYTAPYWDWDRWSEELDWMALHGFNMPLASVASEAIAKRVWLSLGLSSEEADAFFTGAAHLPWHRMGNLNSYDGPLSDEWHEGQIELQHKILDRMRALGMEPVAPAFAGFVPPAFMEKHPEIKATLLHWGGFEDKYNACVLAPDSPYFQEIGKLFIQEWEKEFGKAKYWLSDSFNEMKLPVDPGDTLGKHKILAQYGKAIWSSIQAGDPDAVWVTQGWTFGYQHDFWDPESLKALLSEVPDDRMIIIDLGNDYPKWVWHTDQTWRVQNAFHEKKWIYSYVPNFGGKVLPTGELQMYAEGASAAFAEGLADNLTGFGIAPEGIENNEVVYELLSDMAWTSQEQDLDAWIGDYCLARYGYNGPQMLQAWDLLRKSVYSSLYSYPRFTWQTVVPDKRRVSRHDVNDDFARALRLFLSCSDKCSESELYLNDAVEFAALWLAELADRHYEKALAGGSRKEVDKAVEILLQVDKLLASHPDYSLQRWVDFARNSACDSETADRYEANAKRLITTWGGWQEDYAARFWAGLVKDYYIPRIQIYFSSEKETLDEWEENWINTPYKGEEEAFEHPLEAIELLLNTLE
ncbi:MAG: alpha-N-acetylglucosaminidase [Candidatus Cryptobacteroides sp.]